MSCQRTMSLLAWLLLLCVFGSDICGQDTESKKLEMAYQWSREQFEKENSQVEQDYEKEIFAAQAKRAEAIKMARARFKQGLEFLNANPALPQSMRVKINDEMKRLAALPEPDATAMPETENSAGGKPEKTDQKEVTLKFDAPDSGWSVRILQSKRVKDEIWVLSALEHGSGISAMVVTPVSDSVIIEAPSDLVVRHFVLNKTWKSEGEIDGIKFIGGVPDLGREWVLGELLQMRREESDKE